jgi:rhodanese-related sulfurtransferase/rubrerythrin
MMIKEIAPEGLRKYMEEEREGEYLLVDVRQDSEYVQGHIPGAKLIPIKELKADLSGLPSDKDLIFYCRSGGRSAAAATLAAEEEVSSKKIYSLTGGIMAWEGKVLPDYPKVQVFDKSGSASDLLLKAMDLEKGALRFYNYVKERFGSQAVAQTFEQLSTAEAAHARAVYHWWKKTGSDLPGFDEVFADLKGEILEGGEDLVDVLRRAESLEGNACLNLIELALHIEHSAFDLYRTMAEQTEEKEAKEAFLAIAQAEKAHMNTLIDAIDQCEEPG